MKKLIFFYFLIMFIVLTPHIQKSDGAGYYSPTRSLIIDYDLNLENEKAYFIEQFSVGSIQQDSNTGIYYSQYPIGTSLLWIPFFIIGHLIALLFSFPLDGYSFPYVYLTVLASALMGLAGLLLSYDFCKKFGKAKLPIIAFFFSSSLFYYFFLESTMSHAASFFTVTLFLWYWWKVKESSKKSDWFIFGLLLALATLVRYQNILFAGILIYHLWDKNYLKQIKEKSSSILGFFILFSLQLIVLKYQHGYFFSASQNYQTSINLLQGFWNWTRVLFSSNHGLFLWTPIFLLGFIGLVVSIKKHKKLIISFLFVFLLQLFLVASIRDWHGAQSFGHRMFVNTSLIFMFGLTLLFSKLEKKHSSIPLIIAIVFSTWNFGLMIQYGSRMIPTEGGFNFLITIKNNFIEVPKKFFSILWKFLFDRGSFL